jgi:hypothetical protein
MLQQNQEASPELVLRRLVRSNLIQTESADHNSSGTVLQPRRYSISEADAHSIRPDFCGLLMELADMRFLENRAYGRWGSNP